MIVQTGLFCDGYLPIVDGVTVTVKNYAFWLNKTLGPASIITPFVPEQGDSDQSRIIRYFSIPTIFRPPYRIGIPDIDPLLQYKLKHRGFDIIHAHSPFSAGQLAKREAKERRVPLITTFHSKYRDDLETIISIKSIVNDQIKRIVDFYYAADHVWVPQESVALTLREYGYKGPYEVVENGIDMKPIDDIAPFREKGAIELGLQGSMPVGLYVGQHVLEKNLEFLVRSIPAIIEEVPDFRMVFVGKGYAKQQLRSLVADLGIDESVIFHDVVYDRELLRAIYARADLFLFPSLYDNAPLVVREAASMKTPSILLAGSTASEVIKDGVNGFLAENSADAFVARVVDAFREREKRMKIGEAAQKSLCRTWEDVLGEVKERYLAILSKWA